MFDNNIISNRSLQEPINYHTILPMNLTIGLSSFLRSLPPFNLLSVKNQKYLCQTNLCSLIFPAMLELTQCCFSEPQQVNENKKKNKLKVSNN